MFQLDDNFLKEVGLENLPAEEKNAFLQHIYEQLEVAVGTSLSNGLTEPQMLEFEGFVDRDEQKVHAWFAANMPDYAQSDDYKRLVASAPSGAPEIAILSEYGSLKWLEMNRPDYKQVVALELDRIKKEILENKDAILKL